MLNTGIMMASALLFQFGRTMSPLELTPSQKALFKLPVVKHLLMFSSLYITLRNLFGAIFLYLVMMLFMMPKYGLLSEHSPFSILPEWARREGFVSTAKERAMVLPQPMNST